MDGRFAATTPANSETSELNGGSGEGIGMPGMKGQERDMVHPESGTQLPKASEPVPILTSNYAFYSKRPTPITEQDVQEVAKETNVSGRPQTTHNTIIPSHSPCHKLPAV